MKPQTPECGWTGCAGEAIGGATSDKDPEWVLPLCGSHLYGLSYSIWGSRRKSA